MRLFLTFVLIALAAASVNAADLAGTWKGTMDTQMGATPVTIVVKPGATLAGAVSLGQFEGAMERAKLNGAKVSFEVNIEHGKIVFEGTVAGEEMKLNVTGTQGDKYALVCKRQK